MFESLRRVFLAKGKITRSSGEYLIQFRLFGDSKRFASEISKDISRRFGIKQAARRGHPAHVTLFGPFSSEDEKNLTIEFGSFCKKLGLIKYRLSGFDNIDKEVIFLDVEPSEDLKEMRHNLAQHFMKFTRGYPIWDAGRDFIFHTTLTKDFGNKFNQIWSHLSKVHAPKFDQYLLRITLLRRGRILSEYDLIQRKMLDREAALSREELRRTISAVNEIRKNGGKRKQVVFKEDGSRKVYFISDTHFDHANIIRYCNRPFHTADEMNASLVENWNKAVGKNDAIYFLGDMAFGAGSRPASYWLSKLNGKIIFIEGNHEETGKINTYPPVCDLILDYKENRYFLIHDPAQVPSYWKGWIIHGHKHNNDLRNYPLINPVKKTINVGVELINYAPISIDRIIELQNKSASTRNHPSIPI
ncbi:MAG: 2'-5' RNA ligase family protein [Candidatus Micrarchaeota archaeon]